MNKVETFWDWFQQNSESLIMLNDLANDDRNAVLEALQKQLDEYCSGLSYEIGEPSNNGRQLIFSAEGDSDLFKAVIDLVDNAPDIDWWEFVAFKQPNRTPLKVRFDKYLFDTSKMHFMQLENEAEPDILGLRVAFDGAKPDDEDMQVGVYVTLEAIIGEFDCATLLGYLEICQTPAEPFKEGFRPMNDFQQFVDWFKHKRDA